MPILDELVYKEAGSKVLFWPEAAKKVEMMRRTSIIVERLKGWEQRGSLAGLFNSKMLMGEVEIVERKRRDILVLALSCPETEGQGPRNVQLLQWLISVLQN